MNISICKNDGSCINYCNCICYYYSSDNQKIHHISCSCNHKSHKQNENYYYGYCPSIHCKLINCINFKYCNLKRPLLDLQINNKYCNFCTLYLNNYLKTDIQEYCLICKINENIVLLKCNHKICYNCLVNEHKCNECNNTFPFCKLNKKNCIYRKFKCKICNKI